MSDAIAAGPQTVKSQAIKVEVTSRSGSPDPAGARLLPQIAALGVPGVSDVRVGALYELSGRLNLSQAQSAASQLLADPVTQQFSLASGATWTSNGVGAHWRVEVWRKAAHDEPARESLRKAFADLGLPAPERVRVGQVYKLLGRLTQAQAERVADKLLANRAVHEFTVAAC